MSRKADIGVLRCVTLGLTGPNYWLTRYYISKLRCAFSTKVQLRQRLALMLTWQPRSSATC